jgi:hypothetical protein
MVKGRTQRLKTVAIALLIILIPASINPEIWWARLSPQLWLLPFPFIIVLYYTAKKNYIVYIRRFILVVLIVTILMVGYRHEDYKLNQDSSFKGQLESLKNNSRRGKILIASPGPFEISLRQKFQKSKIRCKFVQQIIGTPVFQLAGISETMFHQEK